MIEQPPLISARGDIRLHGREDLHIPMEFLGTDGEPRDLTGADLWFEVSRAGKPTYRRPLAQSTTAGIRTIEVPRGELNFLLGSKGEFAVIDETEVPKSVIWEGVIVVSGWM